MLTDLNGKEIINVDKLNNAIQSNTYKTALPFSHILIDNLFSDSALNTILSEWGLSSSVAHEVHNDGTFVINKKGTTANTKLPIYTEYFLYQLSRPYFLNFLEKLTGIGGLIPDPYNFGGGLHETKNEGKLAVHVDYNKHPVYKLDRRINLIIYLNKDWSPEMRGELELWDADVKKCVRKIPPIFNRTAIFSTSSISYHGQPDPINFGDGSRKSIALYYFSNGRPEEASESAIEHSTVWKERPGQGY